MAVDILKHEFVPLHEILPKKEAKDLLESLGVTREQLPKIYVSDPVIKRMEAKEGDIIKITRKSRTAGEAVYYRAVA